MPLRRLSISTALPIPTTADYPFYFSFDIGRGFIYLKLFGF